MNQQLKYTSVGQDRVNFKQGQVGCKNLAWWHCFVEWLFDSFMLKHRIFTTTIVLSISGSVYAKNLIDIDFNNGLDSFENSQGTLIFNGVEGLQVSFTDDDSNSTVAGNANGVHITNQNYGNIKVGSDDLVLGAYNSYNGQNNYHSSGIVATFSYGIELVSFLDTDNDYTKKTLFAFDNEGNLIGQTNAASQTIFQIDTSITGGKLIYKVEFDTSAGVLGGASDSTVFTIDNFHVEGNPQTTCQLYAVHDEGLNNSQFFTISPETFEVKALGGMYKAHDIEALDIHPQTGELFAASGKDTNKPAHLYNVNKITGNLTEIGSTGLKEIDGLSFHPDGTLWGWSTGDGLVTIDTTTGKANLEVPYQGEIEDLTWNTFGSMIYGVENLRNNPDSGVKLLASDGNTVVTICEELTKSLEIEALDTLPDNTLIFGLHGKNNLPLGVIDVETCQITANTEITTNYDDVEGIAWPNCQ